MIQEWSWHCKQELHALIRSRQHLAYCHTAPGLKPETVPGYLSPASLLRHALSHRITCSLQHKQFCSAEEKEIAALARHDSSWLSCTSNACRRSGIIA